MNRKNTKWCHFRRGDLRPNVQHIPQSNLNFTVNSVTIPICLQCVSSGKHKQHKKVEAMIDLERKKKALEKDSQELEKTIYPKYQEIASIVTAQRADVDKSYKKLKKKKLTNKKETGTEIKTQLLRFLEMTPINKNHTSPLFSMNMKVKLNTVLMKLNRLSWT